jgi:hypothetical protein
VKSKDKLLCYLKKGFHTACECRTTMTIHHEEGV